MTTPTHDALAASCRAFALQCKPLGVSGVLNEAADLIQQQQATIERLSAELEHLIDIIDGTEATGFDPHVEQMLMDAAETARAALTKDAK